MPEYRLNIVVLRGAFDHWVGEVVPVRGPDRQIIGEATVKSVDHHEDGSVSVVVSSKIDVDSYSADRIVRMLRGRAPMSFSIPAPAPEVHLPHQPMRNDDVAKWLKAKRDEYIWDGERLVQWFVINQLLDEYRARADYGLTLDDDLSQLPDGY